MHLKPNETIFCLQASLVTLEKSLLQYVQNPSDIPFDLRSVPVAPVIEERSATTNGPADIVAPASAAAPAAARMPPTATRQDMYIEKLGAIPQFASFGPLFKSSAPVELTEAETEYMVRCIKHTYAQHVVLQVLFLYFLLFLSLNGGCIICSLIAPIR